MSFNLCLLLVAWWWSGGASRPAAAAAVVVGTFLAGIGAMLLYYRYFHVRRLGYMLRQQAGGAGAGAGSKKQPADVAAVPGVFNCRFSNPVTSAAISRKKKKPTSFIPPPLAPAPPAPAPAPAPAPVPANAFWRRPLPAHNHHGGSSENEGSSVGSRVNIQQKLHEKKQKQLAELRVIEEEIKQGKLAKTTPQAADEIYSSLQRQPIPRAKTHASPPAPAAPPCHTHHTHAYQNYPLPHTCNIYPTYTEIKPEYTVQNFNENTDLNDPLKLRRLIKYENRTFYENPNIQQSNINRTPIRSPNYLIGENRSYESNCGSPRNITNSPRNYIETNNYESTNLDKPRIQNQNIYSDDRQIGEYSGYCENGQSYKYESKDAYVSALQNALASVQNMENIRPPYTEACNQYSQNCDRFPYVLGSKKMEQMRKMQRCRTPEILLAPHYLEGCNRQVCCHWGPPYTNRKKEEGGSSGEESGGEGGGGTPRPHSDIDSQISLPRSYTLPREFRYWRRRPRLRDPHLPSNNSSDGDVDSGDASSSRCSFSSASSQVVAGGAGGARAQGGGGFPPRRRAPHPKHKHKPETKL